MVEDLRETFDSNWNDSKQRGPMFILQERPEYDAASHGSKEEIEWLKKKVREKFNITDLGRMKRFLGIWYEWERDENGPFVKASMNDMAETIIGDYEKHVGRAVKDTRISRDDSTEGRG
jgi:hypothetical protein